MIRIIDSSSKGNAVLYDNVLVDVGVSLKKLTPFIKDIEIVLLTHIHSDHFNLKTLQALKKQKDIVIGCCEWMVEHLKGLECQVMECGKLYEINGVKISPVKLYHDVENCGYRLITSRKIFHATDTGTLKGITARNYDVYAIEGNYDEEVMNEKLKEEGYQHGYRSMKTHLSIQEREQFIKDNVGKEYLDLKLHQSSTYL